MSDRSNNPYEQKQRTRVSQLVSNWVPVAFYTSVFGSISVAMGSVTPGRMVSGWAMHQWASRLTKSLGVRCTVEGAETLKNAPQCVFIANHCSVLDILIIGSHLKRDYRWLAKAPLFKTPFLGWHLNAAGHIPVHRGRDRAKNRNIQEQISVALGEGASILYFPEGTRNPDGRLQPFRPGAFVTAVTQNLPIVPIVLKGTGELMKKGAKHIRVDRSRSCTMTALPPLSIPEDAGDVDERVLLLRNMAQRVFEQELGQETHVQADRSEAG